MHKLKIRSRNHTAHALRGKIPTSKLAVLRLGSTTPTEQIFPVAARHGRLDNIIELNTAEACLISGNKIQMKRCFDLAGVKTAQWDTLDQEWTIFPAIIKHIHSSKGNGIYYINNNEELQAFIQEHGTNNYIIEKYYTYSKEYRVHATNFGTFYACRKMLKSNATERWHRHDSNSVWIREENPLFQKPDNWDSILLECQHAIQSIPGLFIGAVDVKVQASNMHNPEYIILETNSAPSLGTITTERYIEFLTNFLNQ